MKFFGMPVDHQTGHDIMDERIICCEAESAKTFIQYNSRRFASGKLYAIYEDRSNDLKFHSFHSDLPLYKHYALVQTAIKIRGG